jgi:hypothetical protein
LRLRESRNTTSDTCGSKAGVVCAEGQPPPQSRNVYAILLNFSGPKKAGEGVVGWWAVVWRNAMLHMFLNPSPLLVGLSLPMFVAALAAFGDRIWLSPGR